MAELPFGKHRGEDLRDIPLSYLTWIEQQEWLQDDLREDIQFEINRRTGDRPGQGRVIREGK